MKNANPTSLQHIKDSHIPYRNANIRHKEKLTRLDRLALWITKKVGSMGFFMLVFVWTATWLSWNTLAPAHLRFDPFPAFVLWLFISNMLQIFLMPLIIIGLNNPSYAMIAIFFALFGFQIIIGTIQTMPSDYLSGKAVGTLSGLGGFAANMGVLATTWMVPALTKTSYTPFFILAATLVPLGIAVLFIFSGRIEKIKL